MSIEVYKVDLSSAERAIYSKELIAFESEFSYPLGEKRFHIVHGAGDNWDYFSFFEQMGEVSYFVAKDNEKVVGAGCAVLRDSPEGKYWYLCDFKIAKEYRGKGILDKMFKAFFIPCAIKSRKMLTVNMGDGDVTKNGLVNKLKRIFWLFNLKVKPLTFYTWNKEDIPQDLNVCYTNNGKKDLVLEGMDMPLNHVISEPVCNDSQFQKVNVEDLPADAQFMACFENDKKAYPSNISGKGVMITIGLENVGISTAEI